MKLNSKDMIAFNKPFLTGNELSYIAEAHSNNFLSGDGPFTKRCNAWLEKVTGCNKALLTHSCTAALEMAAILAGISPGDEVIMPSYTFVSTANAFVLRGAIPVFVDIHPDTLNIDVNCIVPAITSRTKAIVVVHYSGISCEMDTVMDIAEKYNLLVIEDAAQGIMAEYRGRPLGSIGHIGCYSFHDTKNIMAGEGGALLINDSVLAERAEVIRDKGTNRSKFLLGQVDKYTWVDIGSSYLPSEIMAASLWAQFEEAENITAKRNAIWEIYHTSLSQVEEIGRIRRPIVPEGCKGNAHIYYILLQNLEDRNNFINSMKDRGISCLFHYVPLHSSPFGQKAGRCHGTLMVTEDLASRLVRLPLWLGLGDLQEDVIREILSYLS
jgi:dTDP-4-amino-4,6-dideoxygalactose transaminase